MGYRLRIFDATVSAKRKRSPPRDAGTDVHRAMSECIIVNHISAEETRSLSHATLGFLPSSVHCPVDYAEYTLSRQYLLLSRLSFQGLAASFSFLLSLSRCFAFLSPHPLPVSLPQRVQAYMRTYTHVYARIHVDRSLSAPLSLSLSLSFLPPRDRCVFLRTTVVGRPEIRGAI